MKLKEYQGKELFKRYGIAIPQGKIITSIQEEPNKIAKAQILSGKRGKNNLIAPATTENLQRIFQHCKEILLEDKIEIDKEYYLALTIDKNEKEIIILFSEEGGIEVEESQHMQKIPYKNLENFKDKKFVPTIKSLYKLMKDYNALLVEINPLVISKDKLIALDSKIILDDNVEQNEFKKEITPLEEEAQKNGLSYVDLDGNIAIIGNGAGLVMATLDIINYFGGKVSNFLDLGGGATVEKMEKALEIVLKKKPKAIFINIFGGITKCDDIAKGLVNYKNKYQINIPIIIRIIGTNETKAKEILANNQIATFDNLEECAKKAVEDAN